MEAAIFYDDAEAADVSTRQQPQYVRDTHSRTSSFFPSDGGASRAFYSDAAEAAPANYLYKSLECSGTVSIQELNASLMWWLEESGGPRHAPEGLGRPVVVHMLAVNDREAAAASCSAPARKLTVELPVPDAGSLLTCGVTRLSRGGHHLSLAWLTTRMEAGCVRVTVWRDVDATDGDLFLTMEGETVRSAPMRSIAGGGRKVAGSRNGSTAASALALSSAQADGASRVAPCGPHTSACVLAEVPTVDAAADLWEPYDHLTEDYVHRPNPATARRASAEGGTTTAAVAAMFAVTDGATVWRVKLMESGRTAYMTLRDSPKKEYVGALCAELNRQPLPASGREGLPAIQELSNLQLVTKHRRLRRDAPASRAGSAEETLSAGDEPEGAAVSPTPAAPPSPTNWLSRLLSGGGVGSISTASVAGPAAAPPPPPRRRYLAVCAVQGTPYVALVRWCGLIELYDADLETVDHYPSCFIRPQDLALPAESLSSSSSAAPPVSPFFSDAGGSASTRGPTQVQSWATHSELTNAIHVLVCFGTLEGRRCVWARIPAVDRSTEEKVVLRCVYGLVPPASGSAAMGVAVVATAPGSDPASATGADRETLAVLWDMGVEEESRLRTGRSVGSLLNLSTGPAQATLQLIHGRCGAQASWVWAGTDAYLCYGSSGRGRACAVLSAGGAEARDVVLVERRAAGAHRAYVVRRAASAVAALVEHTRVDSMSSPDDGDVGDGVGSAAYPSFGAAAATGLAETAVLHCVTDACGDGDARRAMRLVPVSETPLPLTTWTMTTTTTSAGAWLPVAALRGFLDGCAVLRVCAHGAGLLGELLNDALAASAAHGRQLLPALARMQHEAQLAGYQCDCEDAWSEAGEGGEPDDVESREDSMSRAVRAAVVAAMHVEPALASSVAAAAGPFCSFGRPYIVQTVLRSLLSRLAFLIVVLVGAAVRGEEGSSSPTCTTATASTAAAAAGGAGGAAPLLLLQAIQLLAAAYHTARAAGPELVRLAPSATSLPRPYASGDELARAILSRLLPGHRVCGGASLPVFVVSVASGLRRCHTPRAVRASGCWASLLQRPYPALTHFRLLTDIDAGRTTRGQEQQDMCMRVVHSLAALTSESEPATATDGGGWVAHCLLDEGFLVADAPGATAFAALLDPASPGQAELRAWALQRPSLAPKLYAVGILRRLVPSLGSGGAAAAAPVAASTASMAGRAPSSTTVGAVTPLHAQLQQQQQQHQRRAAVSAATVRHYYLAELMQVRASVVSGGDGAAAVAWSSLAHALDGLLLDTWLYLAHSAVAEGDLGACWHDLEDAFELAGSRDVLFRHVESFHTLLGRIVECACASPSGMDTLVATSTTTAAVPLEELLVVKWYNYIARMPTKSASDATEAARYRAIMGLYRYLMVRHAYAQCGRVMSDLASLLRCSPLRRSTIAAAGAGSAISVGELAALALAAVELIAPTPAVPLPDPGTNAATATAGGGAKADAAALRTLHGSPVSRGFAWRSAAPVTAAGSAGAGGAEGVGLPSRLLSRDDLPWLRRRVYQAHCERALWRRGSTLDCTDVWIDGAPPEEVGAGLRRLTRALATAELWTEAYRLATLSVGAGAAVDAVEVLAHWAIHLTRRTCHLQRVYGRGAVDAASMLSPAQALAASSEREDIADQWQAIIAYAGEQSCLANQYTGYVRVLVAALTTDYEHTAPELRDAHRDADPYTAAATLLRVFTIMRERLGASRAAAAGDDTPDSPDAAAADGDEEGREAAATEAARAELRVRREALAWLPWAHAAEVCCAVLSSQCGSARPQGCEVFTAGVVDPLVRYAHEAQQVPQEVQRLIAERHPGLELNRVAAALIQCVASVAEGVA